jgi:(1->4)-alpha-D-glucan 1-alpha-D-glucosylmutase
MNANGATNGADSREAPRPAAHRPWHTPVSSYRLQFNKAFTFSDAARLVPYLARLGVGDCYSSPYLMTCAGSQHGYDICDHTRLNPEVGSEQDYDAFVTALQAADIGQMLDFVPNHMGIDPRTNAWWRDVLENGPSSAYGRFFDIDWYPIKPELSAKILLPILGDQYGLVLERGELRLGYEDGTLILSYGDMVLPINPREAVGVYRHLLEELGERQGEDDPHLREFMSILTALSNLPAHEETSPERIAERRREKEVARDRLARLVDQSSVIRQHIARALDAFNGVVGRPESFDLLHGLLEAQPYRLAYWRAAAHEINYRRFFDINALAGLRMEDPEVFAATHVLVGRLIGGEKITGLRIDHPDGLFDPREYFERLQDLAARARGGGVPVPSIYVVAEKILAAGEELPVDWQAGGTTGYNFLNDVNGLFVDRSKLQSLGRIYRRSQGDTVRFEEIVYRCKKLITKTALASELTVLAHALDRIAESNRRSRDFTLYSLRDALEEVVACFPVYRTYVSPAGWSTSDRQAIETAINRARQRNPAVDASIFDFLLEALLPRRPAGEPTAPDATLHDRRTAYPPPDTEQYQQRLQFSMKFQQYTAPVQAKGLEDTAFYRYNLLLSLNEVGGDPARFGRTPSAFHEANGRRLARYPLEMTATATHDTKLGEDVRARINVLSELPDEWRRALSRWMRINASNRRLVDGAPAPDRNDEYRFYQILLGVLPPAPDVPAASPPPSLSFHPVEPDIVRRVREYMLKAIKEAKVHTSWINENKPYDDAVTSFVDRALAGPTSLRFLAAFMPFARRVARGGAVNSLAQLVLKIASPGVPDIYQGTELWDLSLVDPDNRRPVDYARREAMLQDLEPLLDGADPARDSPDVPTQRQGVAVLLADWDDARIKMFVTAAGLRLRRRCPELFLAGDYAPLTCDTPVPAELIAFARCRGVRAIIAVVPRFTARFADDGMPVGDRWKDSKVLVPAALATGRYRNLLTGEILMPSPEGDQASLAARDILATCPVALLWHEPGDPVLGPKSSSLRP